MSLDYLDVAPRFGIVKIRPPAAWVGRSLKELDLGGCPDQPGRAAPRRGRDGQSVTRHRDRGEDELILLGRDEQLERIGR